MSGWDIKSGSITEYNVNDERLWSLFNYVFSDSCKKRNTYKYGLIKALLDNIYKGVKIDGGYYYSYENIFARFAENYWNLIVKYGIKQAR